MWFTRKTGVYSLLLCILFTGIAEMPAKAAFDGQQVVEGQAGSQTEHLKTVFYDGVGIIDSTGI